MSRNIANRDIRTLGIVLRRTNYGEADRILNILTPEGKVAAIAKGVRKEKSKLAGGVEMFSLVELNIHRGKSELGVVTSAKMLKYYNNIIKELGRMELAALILKRINAAAENMEGGELFEILKQCLAGLDSGVEAAVVEGWFWLNLAKITGEELNLYRDVEGEKLRAGERYDWNEAEMAFEKRVNGGYGEDEIKAMRLMENMGLLAIRRIRAGKELWLKVLDLTRMCAR